MYLFTQQVLDFYWVLGNMLGAQETKVSNTWSVSYLLALKGIIIILT